MSTACQSAHRCFESLFKLSSRRARGLRVAPRDSEAVRKRRAHRATPEGGPESFGRQSRFRGKKRPRRGVRKAAGGGGGGRAGLGNRTSFATFGNLWLGRSFKLLVFRSPRFILTLGSTSDMHLDSCCSNEANVGEGHSEYTVHIKHDNQQLEREFVRLVAIPPPRRPLAGQLVRPPRGQTSRLRFMSTSCF